MSNTQQKAGQQTVPSQGIRLNKRISNAGLCARRKADILIQSGQITVNDHTVTSLGYKVNSTDIVKYRDKVLKADQAVYILLNKPKGYLTTTKDPHNRKTVLDLIKHGGQERIYPIGRLDYHTTGLLLLTNDGELARKLSHPSSHVKKIYQVGLDKPLHPLDVAAIQAGIVLADGMVHVDSLEVIAPHRKSLGIEIHMGRNRIIRRLFKHLNYEVVTLDRVCYANLTKRNLSRGQWRFLKAQEATYLKYFA